MNCSNSIQILYIPNKRGIVCWKVLQCSSKVRIVEGKWDWKRHCQGMPVPDLFRFFLFRFFFSKSTTGLGIRQNCKQEIIGDKIKLCITISTLFLSRTTFSTKCQNYNNYWLLSAMCLQKVYSISLFNKFNCEKKLD